MFYYAHDCKGPSLYYVRAKRWVGGPENGNGNFSLIYSRVQNRIENFIFST